MKKRLFILSLLLCSLFTFSACNKEEFILKDGYFIYKYGENISMDPKYYLAEDTEEQIIENAILKINDLEKNEDTGVVEKGQYKGSITYNDVVKEFTIVVED